MRIPSWPATATRTLLGERVSRNYLIAVAVSLALLLLDTAAFSHRSLSITGVLLILLTLPWTPLLYALFASLVGMNPQGVSATWSGWTLTVVAAVVSALINAALLGYAARVQRRRATTR
jgi:hypothetical protein